MIPGLVIINEEREKVFQSKIPNSLDNIFKSGKLLTILLFIV